MPNLKHGRTYKQGSGLYLGIAVALLVLLKLFVFTDQKPPVTKAAVEETQPVQVQEPLEIDYPLEEEDTPQKPSFAPPLELEMTSPLLPFKTYEREIEGLQPAWIKYAVPTEVPVDKPRVAIIIDDMGMDHRHTRAVMDLPGPLTLAFLPYAGDLNNQSAYGRSKGHELMVHVPMQPVKESTDVGPSPLTLDLSESQFDHVLQGDLNAFTGYVGINNHMGSKLTQDSVAMDRVMQELKKRGLLFVDSRTIGTSVAADEAKKAGIPYATRDVFIDHEETYEAASDALQQVEKKALKNGLAIAIGHPREETINALRAWLPTLQAKGIYLVPISAAVTVEPGANEDPDLR